MNYRQKLGYIALGTVIMLAGMTVDSILAPPSVAERDGVFDEIECNGITLVNGSGQSRMRLSAADDGGAIAIYDRTGRPAVVLYAYPEGNGLRIYSKPGQQAFDLSTAGAHKNTLTVFDGKNLPALLLMSHETFGNRAVIMQPTREMNTAITLFADKREGNQVVVYDHEGEITWNTPVR